MGERTHIAGESAGGKRNFHVLISLPDGAGLASFFLSLICCALTKVERVNDDD